MKKERKNPYTTQGAIHSSFLQVPNRVLRERQWLWFKYVLLLSVFYLVLANFTLPHKEQPQLPLRRLESSREACPFLAEPPNSRALLWFFSALSTLVQVASHYSELLQGLSPIYCIIPGTVCIRKLNICSFSLNQVRAFSVKGRGRLVEYFQVMAL